MKFNRKTEADKKLEQFAKNKAKKMGAKAGVKAGKLAAGAAKKIALVLISTIGPPATLVILVIVIFMMITSMILGKQKQKQNLLTDTIN